MHAKTDSEMTSLPPSSPTRSPHCPVNYVQSPSRDSHDGEKKATSFHSTPMLSPMGSPPHSHSSVDLHPRESSSSWFSSDIKSESCKILPNDLSGWGGQHKGGKQCDVIEEEGILENEERDKIRQLPPCPFLILPIIGNLNLLNKPLHCCFSKISNRYGLIFFLHLGSRRILVVSSPAAAEGCLTKNDVVANRPRVLAGKHLGYNYTSFLWASYTDHWRNLRRIFSIHIFFAIRLQLLSSICRDEVHLLLRKLSKNHGQTIRKLSKNHGETIETKPMFLRIQNSLPRSLIF